MIDDYADKTIAKDTNVTDLNHRYNTRLISTRWRHQLEKCARDRCKSSGSEYLNPGDHYEFP